MADGKHLKAHWFHILLSVADRDLHGAAIMEEVLDRTDGEIRLWPGMLYGSLKQLVSRGLIREVEAPEGSPTEGGRRRFYGITARGRAALHREVRRLERFVRVARAKRLGEERG
jgi:DNA-binding PadR family transcriptional regulator